MEILRTENLKKYYEQGTAPVKAIDGVNISIEQGEFVAIVGTSGSGKSTLLNMLGGLDRPEEGEVLFEGRSIYAMRSAARATFRECCFQMPGFCASAQSSSRSASARSGRIASDVGFGLYGGWIRANAPNVRTSTSGNSA